MRRAGPSDPRQLTRLSFTLLRYQKLWKSYVKLRHLLANSPKVKQIDKQKLTQREVTPAALPGSTFLFPFQGLTREAIRAARHEQRLREVQRNYCHETSCTD